MDARENSKVLQQAFDEQEQYISPYFSYPSITLFPSNPHTTQYFTNLYHHLFSTMEFNELENNERANNRGNSNSIFIPSDEASTGEHSFAKSDTDSSGNDEVGGDASDDEEVSLDELLRDGKTKKKIELLAAMVGVDTLEPATVLTEVVSVLKHLKRINQY